MAMAASALQTVDEVLFVLPRVLPHKEFSGAGFEERLPWLRAAVAGHPRYSIGASEGGLFIEIARECQQEYGRETKLYFLCGRDAAERIVNWDYGPGADFGSQLESFDLLVAPRNGDYRPPAAVAPHVHRLDLPLEFQAQSSTEVREKMAAGEPWEHLVPPAVAAILRTSCTDRQSPRTACPPGE
jgi:nicotinic acid mononucleotide adenylyltransferase